LLWGIQEAGIKIKLNEIANISIFNKMMIQMLDDQWLHIFVKSKSLGGQAGAKENPKNERNGCPENQSPVILISSMERN